MDIQKILVEYAKLHLQLIVAQETIQALQAKIAELTKPAEPQVQ